MDSIMHTKASFETQVTQSSADIGQPLPAPVELDVQLLSQVGGAGPRGGWIVDPQSSEVVAGPRGGW